MRVAGIGQTNVAGRGERSGVSRCSFIVSNPSASQLIVPDATISSNESISVYILDLRGEGHGQHGRSCGSGKAENVLPWCLLGKMGDHVFNLSQCPCVWYKRRPLYVWQSQIVHALYVMAPVAPLIVLGGTSKKTIF